MFLPLDGAELPLPVTLLIEDADWGELYLPSVTEIYRIKFIPCQMVTRKLIYRF